MRKQLREDFLLSFGLLLIFAMFSIEVQISVGVVSPGRITDSLLGSHTNILFFKIFALNTYLLFGAPFPLLLLSSRTKTISFIANASFLYFLFSNHPFTHFFPHFAALCRIFSVCSSVFEIVELSGNRKSRSCWWIVPPSSILSFLIKLEARL